VLYHDQHVGVGAPRFPERLRTIPRPPTGLYVQGDLSAINRPAVAIIGGRAAPRSARDWARDMAQDLAQAGFVVVSGLARGIDQSAHRGAVWAQKPTFAFLGGGIERHNDSYLIREMLDNGGALLSEYGPDDQITGWRLRQRNRLIVGLADVVIVADATRTPPAGSGATQAALDAVEARRPVLAPEWVDLPGVVGAKFVEEPADVLREYAGAVGRSI